MSVLMIIHDQRDTRAEVHTFEDAAQAEEYLESVLPNYTPEFDATGQDCGDFSAKTPGGTKYRANIRRGPVVKFWIMPGRELDCNGAIGWHMSGPHHDTRLNLDVYQFTQF